MRVAGVPVPAGGTGAARGGVKRGGGHLPVPEARGRPFSGWSMLNYLLGNAGRVVAAPQGTRT